MIKHFAVVLAIAALAACGGNGSSNNSSTAAGASGEITAVGSTAMLPLVKQAAVDYASNHSGAKISVSGGGSITGITQVAQKAADIGDSDVAAINEPALVDHQAAVVAFGIVVNPEAGIKNLTTAQIRQVFSGKATNWKQVGGADQQISVVNRPRSSGTRAVLVKNVLGGSQPLESGLTQDSSGTVASIVAQTPGAVSYLAMGYVKPGEQIAVSINGVAPGDANVESGTYPYWSYEHMFTNGQPSAMVADFINFVKNDKPLLTKLHFIPVAAMKVK